MARYVLAGIVLVGAFMAGLAVAPTEKVAAREVVSLAEGTAVAISTPAFIQIGKRYAFTWAGGGPPQTHTIKSLRKDGWVEVQVAEENVDPAFLVPGQTPTRWLNAGLATSIQEMRPLPY
jgi:hypothetical protein